MATLVNENREAGQYGEEFSGNQMASGVYVFVFRRSEWSVGRSNDDDKVALHGRAMKKKNGILSNNGEPLLRN